MELSIGGIELLVDWSKGDQVKFTDVVRIIDDVNEALQLACLEGQPQLTFLYKDLKCNVTASEEVNHESE